MNYIKEFEIYLKEKSNKTRNTIEAYVCAIKDFKNFMINATIDGFVPNEVIELDVRQYKGHLLTVKKQSPQTINQKLSSIVLFFEFLIARGLIKNNPAKNVKKVKVQNNNKAPKVLEKNELYRLRREFYKSKDNKVIMIFELLYNTGIRVSELCNIELDDLKITDRKGTLIIRRGKGEKYRGKESHKFLSSSKTFFRE
ncbi:Tyrosine recombinase XerC [Caldisalinibacter kiritimatiensis]|uniref:Tyrosine recombinase XerC n=1 Tax=Caldisalinibacter kiritimatiensis TaxID=1304284 RepID=R1ARG3_9FIRM|nr:Tyrosine recombinase XerC [Caldisalinibacter kiritimatiensis]